jgi:hypothetical protein
VTWGHFLSERHRTSFFRPRIDAGVVRSGPYHASFCSPASASVEISG